MQIQRKPYSNLNALPADACAIIGVFADQSLTPLGAGLENMLKAGDLSSTLGDSLLIPAVTDQFPCRLLLVYCGDKQAIPPRDYQKILAKIAPQVLKLNAKEVFCDLTQLAVLNQTDHWKVFHAARLLGEKFYRFDQYKSVTEPAVYVQMLSFNTPEEKPLIEAQALIHGLKRVKDLGNTPANICNPTYLAGQAKKLAEQFKTVKTEILEEADMAKLGMNTLLAVSKGSVQPPKLICFHYQQGSTDQKPIVFVGKGVTFDSGGISIKGPAALDEMKYDMCGAATVFGIIQTAAELKLPLNIIGLVPAVENMPSGEATRPGDIVTSLSGKTIEILNTDAEGRLILCDTLTYAERFSPDVVIDMATLTMAAILTFSNIANALMGNHQPLIDDLLKASDACGERSWQLPLWEEYQDMLKSNFADLPNIHDTLFAKTIIAGCFLSRFTVTYPWAHIDIAGTAWVSGKDKGATGRPLLLLLTYLLSRI